MRLTGLALLLCISIFSTISFQACSKKEVTNPVDASEANLKAIEENFIPNSLKVTSRSHGRDNSNLFATQPDLFKTVLATVKSLLVTLRAYSVIARAQLTPADGNFESTSASITEKVNNGESELNAQRIGLNFQFLITDLRPESQTSGLPPPSAIFFSVIGNKITYQADFSKLSGVSPTSGMVEIIVTFTSLTEWIVTVLFVRYPCPASAPRTADNFSLTVHHTDGRHDVTSMLYLDNWAGRLPDPTLTCTDPAPEESISGIFSTVAVAVGDNAKLNLGASKRSSDSKDQFDAAGFALSNICNTYSGICGGGTSSASYGNPLCITATGSTWSAAPNTTCAAPPVALAFPTLPYTPKALVEANIELPVGLARLNTLSGLSTLRP